MLRRRLFWLQVLPALIVFLVPIDVSYPGSWLLIYHPEWVPFWIGIGGFATIVSIYAAVIEQRRECDAEKNGIIAEYDTLNREFSASRIEDILADLLRDLNANVGAQMRARVFLKIPDSGNLKALFGVGGDDSPDSGLEYAPDCGWVWDSWNHQRQVWCDIVATGRARIIAQWNFSSGQYRSIWISDVRSVLYTHIPHPDFPDTIIGVLGVDSDTSMSRSQFRSPASSQAANVCAFVIGHKLIKGKLIER